MFSHLKAGIIGAALVAALVTGATSASALTAGSIPGGGSNEGLEPIYGAGTTSVDGYYGAQLALVGGPATVTVSYLGAEAGFENEFFFNGASQFTTPGVDLVFDTTGTGSVVFAGVGSGLLDFSFLSGNGDMVVNGSNIDGSAPASPANFFITFVPSSGATATRGVTVDLWFDDFGGGADDNHDDMVIRLSVEGGTFSVIPVPASIPLLLTALGGLGLVARRRKAAS